jgi:RNA polymerase sigma-70 factor (ECF subfamily)
MCFASFFVIAFIYAPQPRFLTEERLHMRLERFDSLYRAHAEGLFAFAVYRTGDRSLAEDVVADTFERALRARRRFDRRRGAESTWLYTIALNCLRDRARRQRAEQRAVDRAVALAAVGAGSADALQEVEDRDLLECALGSLAPEEREAIALRYGADLSVPEISRVLGVPLSTAEGRVYRALRKLRNVLQ